MDKVIDRYSVSRLGAVQKESKNLQGFGNFVAELRSINLEG
jgi:hypothetical protein